MRVTEREYTQLLARQGKPAKQRTVLPAPTEAQEQEVLMEWARCNEHFYPALAWLFHIPNESTQGKLGRQGVRAGVPDLFLPVPSGPYHGLWIELKRADHSNGPSPMQQVWLEHLRAHGYMAVVCYGAWEAIKALEAYLK